MIFFAKAGGLFEDAHNICLTTWDIRGGYVLPVELIMAACGFTEPIFGRPPEANQKHRADFRVGHFCIDTLAIHCIYIYIWYICYKYTRVWPYYTNILWVYVVSTTPSAASLRNPCSRARRVLAKLHWKHVFLLAFLGDYQWGQKNRIYIYIYTYTYNNITTYVQIIKCHYNLLHILYTFSFLYIYIYTHCGSSLWMHGILDGPMANSEQFVDLSDMGEI